MPQTPPSTESLLTEMLHTLRGIPGDGGRSGLIVRVADLEDNLDSLHGKIDKVISKMDIRDAEDKAKQELIEKQRKNVKWYLVLVGAISTALSWLAAHLTITPDN